MFFLADMKYALVFGTVGSVFGLVATSCEDDFLGIRNNEVTEGEDVANGLAVGPADGLVNFAANIGGDVTCCLLVLTPIGSERVRFFNASFNAD